MHLRNETIRLGWNYKMVRKFVSAAVLLASVSFGVSCAACLWDRDTLAMERQRFPTALELIAGKFLRHSADFYRWRIEDRGERIKAEPSADLYDDLAVAHEKSGDTEEAIRVIEAKDGLYPGLYSTHANLGTFYFHSGRFDLGLAEIDKALLINPNAHFGREIYQKRLVEYLLSHRQEDQPLLPLSENTPNGMSPIGFGAFLVSNESGEVVVGDPAKVVDEGIKGVLGMMKFGNHDSPVLLEALGDLLVSRGYDSDAKQLAARAYLKASYEVDELPVQQLYREKAEKCLKFQTREGASEGSLTLAELESQFQSELNEANLWYETIVNKEQGWITAGENVEQAFENEYYESPVVGPKFAADGKYPMWVAIASVSVSLALIAVVIPVAIHRQRKKV